MESYSITYGAIKIPYQVEKRATRKRTITITVKPDGSVLVAAPHSSRMDDVKQAVRKRARWLVESIEEISRRREHVLPRQYVSGETHFYLGRRYVLRIHNGRQPKDEVKLTKGSFQVFTNNSEPDEVRAMLKGWYREHADLYFHKQLEALVEKLPWVPEVPRYHLRFMQKRWGSCSPKGTLSLNPHIVKAPKECVEYVLLHELCHIKQHNHSKRFYALLDLHMPNWRERKARLEEMAEMILNE